MDRRDFFRILSATSAGALAGGCRSNANKLIPLLVPEHEIVPGEEQWHPAVCAECSAGCGTLVRVMEAVRTIDRNGEPVRQRIAAVKKIEGNPLDPVSGGHLCARGQAVVQSLYHPDRLQGPMKRTGKRGDAHFAPASWDEVLTTVAERIGNAHSADPGAIAVLTGPVAGTRSLALQRFTQALGAAAPVICSLADFPVERKAAEMVFGWKGLPVYDIENAHYALGVGADFLGGWASPVYYARQFGNFRQGRGQVRGYLTQAESRLSLTASSADRWLPLRPGTEAQFLLAVGHMLLDLHLARNAHQLSAGALDIFQSANAEALLAQCGLSRERVREVVQALGQSDAPLVLGGASIVQSNSLDAVVASHFVNLMLGSVGKRGGVLPPAAPAIEALDDHHAAAALAHARVILLDDANPAYSLPRSTGILDILSRAGTVISFSSFVDDSGAWSDFLLPANHTLESEAAVVPSVSAQTGMNIATPFVEPLYDTRALERILADLAKKLNLEYQPAAIKDVVQPLLSAPATFADAASQGGIWKEPNPEAATHMAAPTLEINAAVFNGDASEYPANFQPYLSLQFQDGRGSYLPWMQELPDPASSSIWGLPVELDPRMANQLRVSDGDVVRVQSAFGFIDAPAYVHPGAVPGVVSMAIGDGHTHYGRYASGRGANPLSILAPEWEKSSGQLVTGGTRVRVTRIGGRRGWTQFAAPDREERDSGHR